MGRRTIGPASFGLGEGLVGRDVLVPSHTSDSCGGPGSVHADTVTRCNGVSSDTLVRLASGLTGRGVKKQLCCVSEDAFRSSPLPSPYGSRSDETRM